MCIRLETGYALTTLTDHENQITTSIGFRNVKQPQPTDFYFIHPYYTNYMYVISNARLGVRCGPSFFPYGKAQGCVALAVIVVPSN